MSDTSDAITRGFGKGIGIAIASTTAAVVVTYGASSVGMTSMQVGVFQGFAGGMVLATLLYAWVFKNRDKPDTSFDWDVMNTEVPDEIARNEYMTVISNPDNGPGVYAWQRDKGIQFGEFDSKEMRTGLWFVEDAEMEQAKELLAERMEEP